MPDLPNLPETLKVMGNYNRRMIALIIILTFALAGMTIKAYFGKSDCQSVQEQVDKLTASQGQCIESNSRLMARVDELTKGYLHIDSMLANIKPDTVIKTISEPVVVSERVVVRESSNGEVTVSAPPPPSTNVSALRHLNREQVTVKRGNVRNIMGGVKSYINQKVK